MQQPRFQQQPQSDAGCCEAGLPDACTNDIREENLIQRQQKDGRNWAQRFVERDRFLILSCVVLIFCMNISTGRYVQLKGYYFAYRASCEQVLAHNLGCLFDTT